MTNNNRSVYLTTFDNPYSPDKDWMNWYQFDIAHGYNSCGLLSRFAITSNGFSDADNAAAIERAIDEIIDLHNGAIYKKLVVEEPNDEMLDTPPVSDENEARA